MPAFRNLPVDLVLDVRTRLEYWLGHLPGAINIPVDKLPAALTDKRDVTLESRILVYCASGARSASAEQLLRAAGFTRIVDGGSVAAARAEYSE